MATELGEEVQQVQWNNPDECIAENDSTWINKQYALNAEDGMSLLYWRLVSEIQKHNLQAGVGVKWLKIYMVESVMVLECIFYS